MPKWFTRTSLRFEETFSPPISIEYFERNGVMLYHLDYEQNRQEICNSEWPMKGLSPMEQYDLCGSSNCADRFDLNQRPMLYNDRCQSTVTAWEPRTALLIGPY